MALAPAIILAAACHKNDNSAAADTSLNRDLNLANQVAPYDSISPAEAGKAPAAGLTSRRTTASGATTTRRTTTRRSTSGSSGSSGTVYSSSGGTVAPAPRTVTVKHTQRDAAIGAAAGAVIGATTSRDKLKGGVIGAVVGGVLGGVIGNNVDKQKKPPQ
jgi:hypothetical protein